MNQKDFKMSSNLTTLSICIPTFNRLVYLKEMLEILLPQAEALGVEICISDNSSTDGTSQYLTEVSQCHECIKFRVNETNVGIDLNIIRAMQMAEGKYILPIGDDEVLPDESLVSIIETIEHYPNLDVLFLDGWYTNAELIKTRKLLPDSLNGQFFSDPIEVLDNLSEHRALGCFVIDKDCLSSDWYKKYLGTYHAYCSIIWDYLIFKYKKSGQCSVVCSSTPIVLLRIIEKSWKHEHLKIMLHDVPASISNFPDEYSETKSKIIKNYCKDKSKIGHLIGYRANYGLNKNMIEKYMKHFSKFQIAKAKLVAMLHETFAKSILEPNNRFILLLFSPIAKTLNRW
jgi:glycosyltransferase involved in cell wall biosynthesis